MRSLVLLAFACFVAACGQIGDLYLPDESPPQTSSSQEEAGKKKDPTADVPPGR